MGVSAASGVPAFSDSHDFCLCGAGLAAEAIYCGTAAKHQAADGVHRKDGADSVGASGISP